MMHAYDTAPPPVGLVKGEMAGEPAPPAQQPQAGGDAMQRILRAASLVMYAKPTSEGVVKMLQSGDPATALAQADLFVMKALFDESKGTMPPALIPQAASSVIKLLAELARAAGVQLTDEQVAQADSEVQQRLQQRFGGKAAAPSLTEQAAPQPSVSEVA